MKRIRVTLILFTLALAVSGLTAFPLEREISLLVRWLDASPTGWLIRVRDGLHATNAAYPFMAYGTDWLAFGHLVIAGFFVGAIRDPVRNLWIIETGLVACVGVVIVALVCGPLREIPVWWRLIDCSFGVVGFIPLWLARRWTRQLALDAPRAGS